MKIDAHQHFWQPERGDYDWLPKDNATLNRTYAPEDLASTLARHGIDGTVVVQAAATVDETDHLLSLADTTPFIKAVVGWVNFEDQAHIEHLKRLARHPKFVGVRPMIQDIPDLDWMLRADVQWAYQAIIDLDLTFDALGFPEHLPNFLTLLKRYPEMRVVCDHCMKPRICDHTDGRDAYSGWADGLSRLAEETSAFCKLSGLVTEAGDACDIQDLRPFSDQVLSAFGADRIMWGSDWPVCRLRTEYQSWHQTAQELTSHLSPSERNAVFGGTAARFYRLSK